jgi:hypothetical protein
VARTQFLPKADRVVSADAALEAAHLVPDAIAQLAGAQQRLGVGKPRRQLCSQPKVPKDHARRPERPWLSVERYGKPLRRSSGRTPQCHAESRELGQETKEDLELFEKRIDWALKHTRFIHDPTSERS